MRAVGRGAVRIAVAMSVLACASMGTLEAQRPSWLGFRGDMGIEVPRGALDTVLIGNVRGEFSVVVTPRWLRPVYLGAGQGWVAFPVQPDHGVKVWGDTKPDTDSGEWWNHVGAHVLLGLSLDTLIHVPLYVEGRYVFNRMRQLIRDEWEGRPEVGRRKYVNYEGNGLSAVLGIEQPLAPRTWVDAGLRLTQFYPHVDLSDPDRFGLIDIVGGWMMGLQLGLIWFP